MAAPTATPRRIQALDESVVNRIAAGEIIVAPVNALKELIENSVDAGSTSIDIAVKDGGLKLLQITDNGHGIDREDLPILCERFTTSKLKAFEDLAAIGTYGFRGEALASISMIAHLTVTTKTKDSSCAWRAVYSDGKLVPPKPGQSADPKPVAGRQGTQITVEDLFYNTPSRRRAFRSGSEEYAKILDVVGRYAVHCGGVSFSCKKHGDSDVGLSTSSTANLQDRIRRVHGSAVANELIAFDTANKDLGFTAKGMLSNANYHVKKTTLLLFINGRSVESSAIKKALDAVYSTFLPKGGHPFVYLSLDIEPHRVDVNVHPTKREVNFLHEDEIIEKICTAAQDKLADVDTSRSYALTQTLLPNTQHQPEPSRPHDKVTARGGSSSESSTFNQSSTRNGPAKIYENNTVRVDARDRKITTMFPQLNNPTTTDSPSGAGPSIQQEDYAIDESREWKVVPYKSIKTLRKEAKDALHQGLHEMFSNHVFVGIVDEHRRLAAVQHGIKLYLVDYANVTFELFYQIGLSDFRNFGRIQFNPPLPLRKLLKIAVEEEKRREQLQADEDGDVEMDEGDEPFDWDTTIETIENILTQHDVMLRDYFSLDITSDGNLHSIPLLLKNYLPSLGKLPTFLLRLGPNVAWDSETECFSTFLRELALFYVPESLPPLPADSPDTPEEEEEDTDLKARRQQLAKMVETVLFPAFRKRLLPSAALLRSVTEVANLKGLYRVFERSC
ncbi:DNA mismatch repair protein MutL [Ascodesmis nigricans]|uniref:DNA mismatch repair protein MutL n=1 Tax=Ascodesmis nigricans TaxID=341454 RepID=A0A4S2MKB9_9PEZI|nr:DNA mismatch repair protein MutL [Ascodesmis nigricans]